MNSSTNCYCYCYFLDPDLGPALSQHLTHALDTLSNTLSVEFQQVSTAEALFPSKENAINVGRNQNFIVCLPNKYRCHEIYLCDDTPPHIVSPLWVISSALCKNLQPMVRKLARGCSVATQCCMTTSSQHLSLLSSL